jgi:hypothetical protein
MHCPKCDARMDHGIIIEDGEEAKMGWCCDDCGNFIADEDHGGASAAESAAIRSERPLYNIVFSERDGGDE